MFDASAITPLPAQTGVGYKAQHFSDLTKRPGAVAWLEIHAENYMGEGGRPMAQLRYLAQHFPLSIHGVGLSIGGEAALDKTHLARLKKLVDAINPASFSEHLAWSTHESAFFNDLLPLPYTDATLDRICAHVTQVQNHLGRKMLLENPSSYLAFSESTWSEPDFLREIARRTNCGLLLDVNNVFISASNLDYDPYSYINDYPIENVEEIHLAGHDEDTDELGKKLLIDSHGKPVDEPVWALYKYVISRAKRPIATLVEWDNDVPQWDILEREAATASQYMRAALQQDIIA